MPGLNEYQEKFLPAIHSTLKTLVDSLFNNEKDELRKIFYYHLGLAEKPKDQGKRIRPFLVLLCCEGAGGDWKLALPAAIAVELIHNFSLIHDDIEDNGRLRRGKDAVWVKWGLAKGLNAGDAMYASAFKAIETLRNGLSAEIAFNAARLLSETCIKLTSGQQLDIGFQNQDNIKVEQYLSMISGKTAALLGCCCQMGSLAAGMEASSQSDYYQFGESLGMAFQIFDDWLGIWEDEGETGKSASGDLVEGKKSLPVILGLEKSRRFRQRWEQGIIRTEETGEIAQWLREDGIEELVVQYYQKWTEQAMQSLEKMDCSAAVKQAIRDFNERLINRKY